MKEVQARVKSNKFNELQHDPATIQQTVALIEERLLIQLTSLIIKGLEKKGFKFKTRKEIESFISENCTINENPIGNKTIYYVNSKPFLVVNKAAQPIFTEVNEDQEVEVKGNLGEYSFI